MKKNNRTERLFKRFYDCALFTMVLWYFSIAQPLAATFTRSAGLGIDEDTAWMSDGQYPFIFENPAAMQGYENSIYFEYYNTIKMGGIFIPIMKGTTLGVFSGTIVNTNAFNTADFQSLYHGSSDDPARIDFSNASFLGNGALSTTPLNMRAAAADIRNPGANLLENRNLEIMMSHDMGRLNLGASLSYGFASDEQSFKDTANSNEEKVALFKSEFRTVMGVIYAMNNPVLKSIASSIVFNKYNLDNRADKTLNNVNANGGYESDGAFDLGLKGRATLKTGLSGQVHLRWGYTYLDRSTRSYVTTNGIMVREGLYERIGHRLQVGAANELILSQKLGLFWGAEFFYEPFHNIYSAGKIPVATDAREFDTTAYVIRLPLLLGLTADVTENTDLRFGIRHNVINSGNNYESTTKVNNGKIVTSRSQFLSAGSSISMGLSYRLGPLSFDWLGNVAIFKEGPYFISGKTNDMSAAFAVTFRFGNLSPRGK